MIMKQPQKMRPIFQSKEPLLPIEAGKVQERMPVTVGTNTYKYTMSVIDIFSRFVFLRPLRSKESDSAEVAENLQRIYYEHGPPEIL